MHAYAGRQFVPFLWWSLVWPGREANSRPTVREADTLPTEPARHGTWTGIADIKGAFISAGGSWNLIAFPDLRVCLGEFIERDHGPVDPAWEVGS